MVTNPKELPWGEFLVLFDAEVHAALNRAATRPGVTHLVCFTNLDLCSSQMGHRTACVVGEPYTYRNLDMAREGRLGDVPSRFQYPTEYAAVPA